MFLSWIYIYVYILKQMQQISDKNDCAFIFIINVRNLERGRKVLDDK